MAIGSLSGFPAFLVFASYTCPNKNGMVSFTHKRRVSLRRSLPLPSALSLRAGDGEESWVLPEPPRGGPKP